MQTTFSSFSKHTSNPPSLERVVHRAIFNCTAVSCFILLSITMVGCHRLPGIPHRSATPSPATPLGRLLRASERDEGNIPPLRSTENRRSNRQSANVETSRVRQGSSIRNNRDFPEPEHRLARLRGASSSLGDDDHSTSPIEILTTPKRNSFAQNRIEIIETDTPDANLQKDLERLPSQLRELLVRQLAITTDDLKTNESLAANWEPVQNTKTGGVKVSLSDSEEEDLPPPTYPKLAAAAPANDKFISVEPGKPNGFVQLASAETTVNSDNQPTSDLPEIVNEHSTATDSLHTLPSDTKGDELSSVSSQTWSQAIQLAIEKLESEMANSPPANSDVRLHQEATLRMLRLANGRLDDALDPIEGLNENEREYFRHQLQAFYEATNPDSTPVRKQRWSLVMNSQQRANQHLSAVSNLMVSRVALCTDVQGFGQVIEFDPYQFQPDQDVLLYCELDNVASEAIQSGFETQLQGSYEIVDPAGNRIADQLLPMEKEVCQNARRDYFIVYRIYMPPQIADGTYELRLTIEDMKAKKFGQKSVEFQITN